MTLQTRIQQRLKTLNRLFPKRFTWHPQPGNQTLAYHSPADELFYGGAPGGGKTDLILGLALLAHKRSLILRRRALDLAAIRSRVADLTGVSPGLEFSINKHYVQFGGCKDEGTKYKYQGQPHDLKAFDEVHQFLESQYQYIKTWNRTTIANQRCRVVSSFNPPTSQAQRWVINYLAPWLDPRHPRPARSGELRYYVGKDEVVSGDPIVINGKLITPLSRSFILSRTSDNPLLMATNYGRILDNLPLELQALTDFSASMQDEPYQVIPTAWVEQSQDRWRSTFGDTPMPVISTPPQDSIAADIARGGTDETTIATRHADYVFIWGYPGAETPDGAGAAAKLLLHRQGTARITVDVIGWGSSAYDHLMSLGEQPIAYNGANRSAMRTRSGQFGFINKRAESWWKLREALDPEHGSTLALPPHPKLLGDLTSPHWFLSLRGIQVESKDEIKKRLGRSPDYGDAAVMACDLGMKYISVF